MFTIRKATKEDCPLIHEMASIVFPHTYKEILSPEQTEYMMDWMYSVPNLEKQMKEEGHIYFIAYEENVPCGYLSIEQQKEELFHLHKIYVLPSFQGKQYGKKLFKYAIDHIKSIHESSCIMELNVNRYNKAITFYERLGMKKVREGDFQIGNGFVMEDYIMAIEV